MSLGEGDGQSGMNDENIIALFWERSEAAIDETKKKYGSFLYRLAKNVLQDSRDAEECESDTYLHAWKSIPPSRPVCLKTYLAKIARNISISRLRKRKAQKRGGNVVLLPYEELEECIPDERRGEQPDADCLRDDINSFLSTLPQEQRILFMQRYWMAYSVQEIARQTGKKEKYITNHLYLIRKKLKLHLEGKVIVE